MEALTGRAWQTSLRPLVNHAGWLRAYAAFHAIVGLLLTLTLFGVILAWVFFWVAWVLHQAATAADAARQTGSPEAVARALDRFAFHLIIQLGLVVALAILMGVFSSWVPPIPQMLPGAVPLPPVPTAGVPLA